jgi:hypothetical protein
MGRISALAYLYLILLFLFACRPAPGPISETGGSSGGQIGPHIIQAELPADLDTSLTRLSEQGLFEVSVHSQLDPIIINEIHAWVITVSNKAGESVEYATISVDHLMPQHGHGMPTEPEVTQNLGGGDYLVEGMKFNMRGWWVIEFTVETSSERDHVIFNLILR